MKKILSSIALASSVALLPLAAQAQTPEGPYVAIQGGVNFMNNPSTSGIMDGRRVSGSTKNDTGFAAGGVFGYSFGSIDDIVTPRIEVEGTYRRNSSSNRLNAAGTSKTHNGPTQTAAGMVNALFDFNTGTDFYPYIGGGVGAVWGWLPTVDDVSFGYQGIAGVGYNITENLGVTVDYRYLGTTNMKDGDNKSHNLQNHTVMAGIRWSFGAPAPAPVEPVAQQQVVAVPDSYLVFFDFDKYNITPEASGIIATAANNAKSKGTTMIEVTGHTDTVGSAKYNMALSLRRAEAVTAELERNGIPRTQVAVYGKGKNDLLVPTPDGVREPQNRRVVIVLK